ncbi:MAG: hypothetical protein Q4F15_01585 [Bacillota bacterium]|nr:hypothetical protein [Bacillota bacterium]
MQAWLIILILVLFFGAIVLGVIVVRKKTKFFDDPGEKKSDEEIAKEELDNILEDVEDEETIKAMDDFSKKQEESETEKDFEGEDKPVGFEDKDE